MTKRTERSSHVLRLSKDRSRLWKKASKNKIPPIGFGRWNFWTPIKEEKSARAEINIISHIYYDLIILEYKYAKRTENVKKRHDKK